VRTRASLAGASAAALAFPAAAAAHTPVPVSRLPEAWDADPVVLALAALSVALFVQAFVRLRRRGRSDHAPWSRVPLFVGAVALGTLALVSPLDATGEQYLISAHMLQHVLIADAAVALALVAVRGPLVLFLLPPRVLGPLGRSRTVRGVVGTLVRPAVALALWVAVMATWHVPAAYDYALSHRTVHALEHLSFVVVGVLVWTQLVDPARHGRLSPVRRLGYAGLLFALGMVLADVLIFSFHPLYPAYAHQQVRMWGISPLRDQQLAGIVMTVEQLLTLGICAALLLRVVARRRPARAPRAAQART